MTSATAGGARGAVGFGRFLLVIVLLAAGLVVAVRLVQAAAGLAPAGAVTVPAEVAPGAAPGGARLAVSKVYIVKPGDTLWSIVEASGYQGDIRPVVDRLVAAQHGRPLQVGQMIVLP